MAIEYGCQEIGTCKIAYDSIVATELLKSELESLSSEFPELAYDSILATELLKSELELESLSSEFPELE